MRKYVRKKPLPDRSVWSIVDLCDSGGRVRWSGCQHKHRAPCWKPVYDNCEAIGSKLAVWFCALKEQGIQPVVKTWLGKAVGLDEWGVMRMCKAHIQDLREVGQCDLNWWDGDRRKPRPVVMISDGGLVCYPSLRAAGRELSMNYKSITVAIMQGQVFLDN